MWYAASLCLMRIFVFHLKFHSVAMGKHTNKFTEIITNSTAQSISIHKLIDTFPVKMFSFKLYSIELRAILLFCHEQFVGISDRCTVYLFRGFGSLRQHQLIDRMDFRCEFGELIKNLLGHNGMWSIDRERKDEEKMAKNIAKDGERFFLGHSRKLYVRQANGEISTAYLFDLILMILNYKWWIYID